jgi:hypothetical protein
LVLALLGRSRLANNLNQLAYAANIGSLPLTPETEEELQAAIAKITSMTQQCDPAAVKKDHSLICHNGRYLA